MPTPKLMGCFDRRYLGRMTVVGITVLALAFGAKQFDKGSTERLALIVAECVAVGYLIATTTLAIRRLDELSQRIHLVAMAISFTVTAVLATALGLLGKAGLPLGDWYLWVWPFMALVWAAGAFVIRRRYQ
jgi:hypothetical protein